MPKIRLFVVDDSPFFRAFLTQNIEKDPAIEIVGSFGDPVEASKNIQALRPDVIALDMEMPRMRSDEFLRTVVPKFPNVKTIVISALSDNVFDALQAGAVDFVGKPGSSPGYDESEFIKDIIAKIKVASTAHTRRTSDLRAPRALPGEGSNRSQRPKITNASLENIIAIGASTGGTEAILSVVKKFPANTPGIVVVQHMPPIFTKMYAERLNKNCAMNAVEARNGDRVEPGTIYIAPGGDQQLYVRRDSNGYYLHLNLEEKVSDHCPSVDVLFNSVAEVADSNAVGVLLTGTSSDGASGLVNLKKTGAHTIGQNEETCVVYGMPKEAYNKGGIIEQLPLSAIGDAIIRRFG